ncbi:RHS repeat-associated core domain-containing protein [Catenovulum agarivorans]|nr:RHS repeat-associated core domain-containing protein [Catenovulum agarivorans]
MYSIEGKLLFRETAQGSHNYIYLGDRLVAKEGTGVKAPSQVTRSHYRDFGQPVETPKDDVGYTGHKFDADLGLSYMQARYYDPVIGRFYSNDPVDAVSHLSNEEGIKGFNRYSYAVNNPYKYVDPDGREIVALPKYQKQVEGMINSLSSTQFKFDSNNKLQAVPNSQNSSGSKYYASRISDGISSKKTIGIAVEQKIGSVDIDKHKGGGATFDGNTGDQVVVVSGNSNTYQNGFKNSPEETLAHELVGHAIPSVAGGDSGNAVDNTNKIRTEVGLPLRPKEPNHVE